MLLPLLALLACAPEPEGHVVVEGDYTFSAEMEGTGSCGPSFAGRYFVTTEPATVTIAATETGFSGISEAFAESALTCVGDEDFDCSVVDATQDTSDAAARLSVRGDASGEWDGDTTLDGTWTLAASCTGDYCEATGAAYGFEFPCTWTQPFEAAL